MIDWLIGWFVRDLYIEDMFSKNHFSILLLVFLFIVGACEKQQDSEAKIAVGTNFQTLVHNGETREYILHVPETYSGDKPLPLLFNFHGFGGNATAFMNETNMRSLADSEEFILVYPQGTLLGIFPHWNTEPNSVGNKSSADDFGFIETLIDQLAINYQLDLDRIYACGFSNGGMFSYALACHKSNLFAAIGSISGTMLDTDCAPEHPTAIINIHGTNDSVLPYDGNSSFNSVASALNYWKTYNNTLSTPLLQTDEFNGMTIEQYTYNKGDNGVSVVHYKIIKGEHDWFDIQYKGQSMEEVIWNFFAQHDINGRID